MFLVRSFLFPKDSSESFSTFADLSPGSKFVSVVMHSVSSMRWNWTNNAVVTNSPKNSLFHTSKNEDFEIFFIKECWKRTCSKNELFTWFWHRLSFSCLVLLKNDQIIYFSLVIIYSFPSQDFLTYILVKINGILYKIIKEALRYFTLNCNL